MAANWFYADAQNQQQGPVERAWLGSAFRTGAVTAATLVWREGLANWVPLSQVANELHLVIVGGPSAAPWQQAPAAATPRIVKPTSSTSAGVIVAIVAACLVPVIGILAAIALPAYQDYTLRAKVSGALVEAAGLKTQVAEFFETEKRCPHNGEGGIEPAETYATPVIASIHVGVLEKSGECAIQIAFKNFGSSSTEGKTLLLAMSDAGVWRSSSTLPPKYLPISMRRTASP